MTGAPPKVPTAAWAVVALVAALMRAVSAAAAACAAATARAKEGALPVAALLEALNTALLEGSRTALLGGGSGGACEGGCCSDGCDGSAGDGRQSGGSRAAWRWELERDACAALERDACAAIGGAAAALWNGCPELRFVNCRTSSWERVSSRREGSMLWWRGGWGKTTSTIPSRGQSRSRSAPVALSSRPGPVPCGPLTEPVPGPLTGPVPCGPLSGPVPGPVPEPLLQGGASPRGGP